MRIAHVEDNADLREEVAFHLRHLGHRVEEFATGEALLSWLVDVPEPPDLLLLDLGLPDRDGIELARTARALVPELAIVMLTARTKVDDRVEGWQAGADAYLTKPVDLRELVAVMQRLVGRRHGMAASADGWVLHSADSRLDAPDGHRIELTFAESSLLGAFAGALGRPVARESLVEAMGLDPADYDMRRLEAVISRLRSKLRPSAGGGDPIRAVRGQGYHFAARLVKRL